MRCNWGRIILYFMLAPEFEYELLSHPISPSVRWVSHFCGQGDLTNLLSYKSDFFFASSTVGDKFFETFVKWAANGGIFRERKQSGSHPLYKVGLFDHCYYVI